MCSSLRKDGRRAIWSKNVFRFSSYVMIVFSLAGTHWVHRRNSLSGGYWLVSCVKCCSWILFYWLGKSSCGILHNCSFCFLGSHTNYALKINTFLFIVLSLFIPKRLITVFALDHYSEVTLEKELLFFFHLSETCLDNDRPKQ